MNRELDFRIEDKPLEMLYSELEFYPMMTSQLKRSGIKRDELEKKLWTVKAAQLNTLIAIIYHHYCSGGIDELFASRLTGSESGAGRRISFGGSVEHHQFTSLICKMLSQLSIDHISMSADLTRLYYGITEYIKNKPQGHRSTILTDVQFWRIYFQLYNLYWKE